jgi:hypothetical protein
MKIQTKSEDELVVAFYCGDEICTVQSLRMNDNNIEAWVAVSKGQTIKIKYGNLKVDSGNLQVDLYVDGVLRAHHFHNNNKDAEMKIGCPKEFDKAFFWEGKDDFVLAPMRLTGIPAGECPKY